MINVTNEKINKKEQNEFTKLRARFFPVNVNQNVNHEGLPDENMIKKIESIRALSSRSSTNSQSSGNLSSFTPITVIDTEEASDFGLAELFNCN